MDLSNCQNIKIDFCTFTDNIGNLGGALSVSTTEQLGITKCYFSNNSAIGNS